MQTDGTDLCYESSKCQMIYISLQTRIFIHGYEVKQKLLFHVLLSYLAKILILFCDTVIYFAYLAYRLCA